MAESFQAVTTSLNEAERVNGKKAWTIDDYEKHRNRHNNIDETRTKKNKVFVSAEGKSEKQLVNDYFHDKMIELNDRYKAEIEKWNNEHVGLKHKVKDRKTGEIVDKPYKKKSIDKRRMYPVGEYEKNGKRVMPYDIFKQAVERGNARAKPDDSTHMRTGVLQQYIVGWGNTEEWNKEPRNKLRDPIYNSDDFISSQFKKAFEDEYIKPFLDNFKKENPNLHIVQAVVQYDETNPHLHMTVLPHLDNNKNTGLGSTAFTDVLKHDHPNYEKTKIFDDFYNDQHEYLRKQLNTIKYQEHPNLPPTGMLSDIETLGVGKPLKRTSKGRSRTNLVNKMIEDRNNQLKWVAEKNKELNQREEDIIKKENQLKDNLEQKEEMITQRENKIETKVKDLKQDTINLIAELEPTHQVPKDKLGNQQPQNVTTPQGRHQHQIQPIEWLHKVAINLLKEAKKKAESLKLKWIKNNDTITKQQENINKQQENNKAEIQRLYEQEQHKLNEKINEAQKQNAIKTYKMTVKEKDLNDREQGIYKREQLNNKILHKGLSIVYPVLSQEQITNVINGTQMIKHKTGYEALIEGIKDKNISSKAREELDNLLDSEELHKDLEQLNKQQQNEDKEQ